MATKPLHEKRAPQTPSPGDTTEGAAGPSHRNTVTPRFQKVLHPDEATVTTRRDCNLPTLSPLMACPLLPPPFRQATSSQSPRHGPESPKFGRPTRALRSSAHSTRCAPIHLPPLPCRPVRGAPLAYVRPSRLAKPPQPQPAAARAARASVHTALHCVRHIPRCSVWHTLSHATAAAAQASHAALLS